MEWTIEKFLWGWNVSYAINVTDKVCVKLVCGDKQETFVVGDAHCPSFVLVALEQVLHKIGAKRRGK